MRFLLLLHCAPAHNLLMRYFTPHFQIATLAPPQARLLSKIGGIPWGLPPHLWPHHCGYPQKLIAQLCHEPPMLDLGAPDTVLHLFMCGECGGIKQENTGLDALILHRSQLTNSLTTIPNYDHEHPNYPPLTGELWITHWTEHDDGIPPERLPDFYDWQRNHSLHDEFPHIPWFESKTATKFGGSPRWTGNGPMQFPPPPFEFLLQLDSYLFIDGPPPAARDVGCSVETYSPTNRDDSHTDQPDPADNRLNVPWYIMHERGTAERYLAYTNLGSDGTAFVFLDRTHHPPTVRWFYNR